LDLEAIANQSVVVKEQAERLATASEENRDVKPFITAAHLRSRLKPTTSVELMAECEVWSVDDLVGQPATVKGSGSVTIGGVKAHTQQHKLAQQLVVSIEDCVDADADENATSNDVQYAAIIRDFTSFEVEKKVFAYQVSYGIGWIRNGQIIKRFSQPVVFYYVDQTGDGTFELFKGSMAFDFFPDWAKGLARKTRSPQTRAPKA